MKKRIGQALAIGVVIAVLLVCGAIAAGLRINGTHSFPVGLYLARCKRPEIGDLVFVNPPALPIFTLAKERGYLNVAYSAASHLLKRLAAAADNLRIEFGGNKFFDLVNKPQCCGLYPDTGLHPAG